MKKMLFVMNPFAGLRRANRHLTDILLTFNQAGYEVITHMTLGQGDAAEVVERHGKDVDLVVCCGGDGTLNEMVSGMMQREEPVPMGYIPLGSTNDFAASLHLPSHVEEAALRCVEGTAFHMDVGSLNDRYFNDIAAFGAFTEASCATPRQSENAPGHPASILEGAKSLGRLQPIHVRITADGESFEEDYLFGAVTNTVSLGGVLRLDPSRVLLDDGMYELLLVKNPQNPAEAQAMLSALMLQNYDGPLVRMLRASDILFESNHEISWTIDGEFGGSFSTTHILNNKNAVTLMV